MRILLTFAATLAAAAPAAAQTRIDSFIGEIQLFGGIDCPVDTIQASGALLSIAQNPPLYAIMGTAYGGDGNTTFALPDLRGRAAVHMGQGPGLSDYHMGQAGGTETWHLTLDQMPRHHHAGRTRAVAGAPNTGNPAGAALADFPAGRLIYNNAAPTDTSMAPGSVLADTAGGGQPVANLKPFVALRQCVVTHGYFPPRN